MAQANSISHIGAARPADLLAQQITRERALILLEFLVQLLRFSVLGDD